MESWTGSTPLSGCDLRPPPRPSLGIDPFRVGPGGSLDPRPSSGPGDPPGTPSVGCARLVAVRRPRSPGPDLAPEGADVDGPSPPCLGWDPHDGRDCDGDG